MNIDVACATEASTVSDAFVVDVHGAITEASGHEFCDGMNAAVAAGAPLIVVRINSHGGEEDALQMMMQSIRSCPVPVATVVTSIAYSSAAVLFSCGRAGLRFMSPGAMLMFHRGTLTVQSIDMAALTRLQEALRAREKAINAFVETNCGVPAGTMDAHGGDWYVTAEEAKAIGFASEVGLARVSISMRTFVSVTVISADDPSVTVATHTFDCGSAKGLPGGGRMRASKRPNASGSSDDSGCDGNETVRSKAGRRTRVRR
jgi:ATP-dependent protease ClpP protease subunit